MKRRSTAGESTTRTFANAGTAGARASVRRYRFAPVLVIALLAALSGSALGASPSPVARQISALQKTVKLQAQQIATLKSQVTTLAGQTQNNSNQVGNLTGQIQSNTGDITAVGNTLTCRTAQLFTLDEGFIDAFDILAGQPEQFVGQVVPDNGTCAAVGLTPPSPAGTVRQPVLTPLQAQIRDIGVLLGVARP